ncbi:hypothetical protein N7492_004012 [Penicillium capsulatum]|uniref:SnoaL-like domain-containing protein n=1 Tax=Penicillium capsulatum TaxID=69766 RepID=A0A9W9LXZ7_9EURO|nr:hypothetical protein N7492_004012 [Penicillium capsulatum]KAJ6121412.1 hypothetical protein N7512_003877 [Penicillium capsulatum]
MATPLPYALSALTPREAVMDAVSRMFNGIDGNDLGMFNSALRPEDTDTIFEVRGASNLVATGAQEIRTWIFDRVGPMDTTHALSHARVQISDDARTARVTASGMAQHCPPGRGLEPRGPKYMAGGKYSGELELGDDGLWKIRKFVVEVVWGDGDESVMQPSV